jgi:putative oxidoreductase
MKRSWTLTGLAPYADLGPLALRLLTGAFLMHGTLDNIREPARMAEFVGFMRGFGFPAPELLAPFSVYTQFGAGALLALGLLTRWAGVTIFATFVVAMLMVHANDAFRVQWPAAVLVALGFHFMAAGGGRWSLDRLFGIERKGR